MQKNDEATDKSNFISASEIGKFAFCPVGWYLEKRGFVRKTETAEMQKGKAKHQNLATGIERRKKFSRASVTLFIAALLVLIYLLLRWVL